MQALTKASIKPDSKELYYEEQWVPGDRKFAMEPFFVPRPEARLRTTAGSSPSCTTPPTKRVTLAVAVPKWLLLMRKSLPKVGCSTSPPDVRAVRRARLLELQVRRGPAEGR